MAYTRETILAEHRESIEREIASLERRIQSLRKEIDNPKDPIHNVFYTGLGDFGDPLKPLVGTPIDKVIKAGIVLANEVRRSQFIQFNGHIFDVRPGEDLKDVALRDEYVREILFPYPEAYFASRQRT